MANMNALASMMNPQAFNYAPTPEADPRVAMNLPARNAPLSGVNLRAYSESPTGAIEAARDLKEKYGIDVDPAVLRKAMDEGQFSFTFGQRGNVQNAAMHEAIHDRSMREAMGNLRLNREMGMNLPVRPLTEQETRNQAWAQSVGPMTQPSMDYNMLMAYANANPAYRSNALPFTTPYAAAQYEVNRIYGGAPSRGAAEAALSQGRLEDAAIQRYLLETAQMNPAYGTRPGEYVSRATSSKKKK